MEEMKGYHFIIPKGFSLYKNSSIIYQTHVDKRYIASVYSHVLFLYSITKAHKYEIVQEENGTDSDVELGTYLKDLFDSYYAEFLLNFGFDEIMQLLEN